MSMGYGYGHEHEHEHMLHKYDVTPEAPDSAGSPEVDSIASEVPFNSSICLVPDVGICVYIYI